MNLRSALAVAFLISSVIAATCPAVTTARAADATAAEPAAPEDEIFDYGTPAAPDTIPGHKFFPLPFVFYQPETRFGGGFGVLHTFRTAPDTRPSSNALLFVYTERKQFSISLEPDFYTAWNRWRMSGSLLWSRFPDTFYGIGNDTRSDDDESWTAQTTRASADVRRAIAPGWYAEIVAAAQNTKIRKTDPAGSLASSNIVGHRGGNLASAGVLAVLDDRDNVFAPSRGRLVTLGYRRYDGSFGSDFESDRAELDARLYTTRAPGHTFATQLIIGVSSGRRPFYDLNTLGGANVLRGIYEGRYRDRNRAVVQAEYRFPVLGGLGGALFAGAGEVARDAGRFQISAVHAAGGLGIRYLVLPREGARLRIDAGWAKDGMQIYLGFGEAF